jgi:hypothetical protein
LYRIVLKNIIFNNKSKTSKIFIGKLNSNSKEKIIDILKNTLLCIDIANRLTWNNVPKKLFYLEILYNNKELIINGDKINKNIFIDIYDNRLRKIIENPYEMFKYLKKESDYGKWLNFLTILDIKLSKKTNNSLIMNLFTKPISLSPDDINHLGKIIYLLFNIAEQHIKDDTYIAFLNYTKQYKNLLLDSNETINLKIKEYFNFTKCNINLGFLAKHLTFDINNAAQDAIA